MRIGILLLAICNLLFVPRMTRAGEKDQLPVACTNDHICDAVDLGTLTDGVVLGDVNRGLYDNTCGTNTTDPNPNEEGSWYNEAGVWFSFRTDDDPTPLILIGARNDPEGTGDEIDLEIAVYRSFDGDCDGFLRFEGGQSRRDLSDAFHFLNCPRANTTYFILVDGTSNRPGDRHGVFGIEVREIEVTEAPDSPCRAEELGRVPDGGAVTTNGLRSNACATSFGDPRPSAFATQVSVWFTFQAPASGHVRIDGLAKGTIRPLGVQLALFLPVNRSCSGTFREIASAYSGDDPDESIEATCLYPGETYYIMVDGYGTGGRGMFSLLVTDLGDITPVTRLDTILCYGDSLQVGNSIYTTSGNYSDTLQVEAGCDSIVLTSLTVLEPLQLTFDQTEPAVWQKEPGTAVISATGGAGGYDYQWCDGTTGSTNHQLVAGAECRVLVTDDLGCRRDTSFAVAFTTRISIAYDTVRTRCAGDSSGLFSFSAADGIPPYQFEWRSLSGSHTEQGVLAADDQSILFELLPAGDYELVISDAISDTAITLTIAGPAPLVTALLQQQEVSCFGTCDAAIEVATGGGTGNLRFRWSNGAQESRISGLCAGVYSLTVADQNDCRTETSFAIWEPPEFVALAEEYRQVSCFGGTDGIAVVRTNGKFVSFSWDNGQDSAVVRGLKAGEYTVTATNEDGCKDIATARITEPAAPLAVRVDEQQPVSCFGATDGILHAMVSGPFENLSYEWNGSGNAEHLKGAGAGAYTVLVTNERGCSAEASYTLTQPEAISTVVRPHDITCLDPDDGGELRVEAVSGGRPDYEYSLDGVFFQADPVFNRLFAGEYEVIVRDQSGCEAYFPAEVQGPPELHVDLGGDRILVLGDTIQLEARSNSSNLIYNWEPADYASTFDPAIIKVGPIHSTPVRVTVVDTVNSCTATDQVLLTVRKDRRIYIPNAFSPNGDGVNDHFMIYGGKGIRVIRSFRIFGRSGALVHEAHDLMPGDEAYAWDGAFRGQALSSGVFVYAAEIEFLDGVVEVFKGDLVLVR